MRIASRTVILIVLSLCLFVVSGLLMRGVVTVRPVQSKGREATRAPKGRPLMERDALGQLLINGDAYACMGVGFVLLGWALTRICLHGSTRHGELEEHDA